MSIKQKKQTITIPKSEIRSWSNDGSILMHHFGRYMKVYPNTERVTKGGIATNIWILFFLDILEKKRV